MMRQKETTHSFQEELFFGNFKSTLISRFNIDQKDANDVAYEVLEILQTADTNIEEVNLQYQYH